MIIQNGTIEILTSSGGGLDAKGFPIPETEVAGQPIECQYSPIKFDALSKVQGEPTTEQKYTILLEMRENISAERLRLTGRNGIIGIFSVVSIEYLDAVDQIRLIV